MDKIIRLALMSAHYKQPLDWNDKLINDCQNTLDKWYRIYSSDIKICSSIRRSFKTFI